MKIRVCIGERWLAEANAHGSKRPGAGHRRPRTTWRSLARRAPAACLATLLLVGAAPHTAAQDSGDRPKTLRVCADPNNLPFSNRQEEGFENKIAELIAKDLGTTVSYTWWPQRRGFIRNTLRADKCDVVMGVPSSYELVLATKPYYRSTYVFVYPKKSGLQIESLDDPVLRTLKIGVHTIGDDYANSPPAHALGARHIVKNVVGYSVYGDYDKPNPPGDIMDAVGHGDVDVAIVWGPIAGYFAKRQPVELELIPVSPRIDLPFLPFVYDISMGVRREDVQLKERLEEVLDRRAQEIRKILESYGVPLVGTKK